MSRSLLCSAILMLLGFIVLKLGCGRGLPSKEVHGHWLRLESVQVIADAPEAVVDTVARGGSFAHAAIVHGPGEAGAIFEPPSPELARRIFGEWYAEAGSEPWSEAATWAREAAVGAVSPPLEHHGGIFLFRVAQRLEDGASVVPWTAAELLERLADDVALRRRAVRGELTWRLAGGELLALLETHRALDGDHWGRLGPAWLALCDGLAAEALRARVLWIWREVLRNEHRLLEAAVLTEDLLETMERLRFPERMRGYLVRQVAHDYEHFFEPLRSIDLLLRTGKSLSGEGLYIVLVAMAEQLEEFGLYSQAHAFLAHAANTAEVRSHIHGPNHHLVRSRIFLAEGRFTEGLAEIDRARRFAGEKLSTPEDLLPVDELKARLLLRVGRVVEAEELAYRRLDRIKDLTAAGAVGHFCRLPSLHLLAAARLADGDRPGQLAAEEQIITEARKHSASQLAVELSQLAEAKFANDPLRAEELFLAALAARDKARVRHISPASRLAFLRWNLMSGRHPEIANRLAHELYSSYAQHDGQHLPTVETPYKEHETRNNLKLLHYFLAQGDQVRAVRTAERIVAMNIFRSMLAFSTGSGISEPEPKDEYLPGIEILDEHYATHSLGGARFGRLDAERRRQLSNSVRRLVKGLSGDDPYPYARNLAPGDLFVAPLLDHEELYLLWFVDGRSQAAALPASGSEVRNLAAKTLDLASAERFNDEALAAAEQLYQALLGHLDTQIQSASRLVVHAPPELADLPFGLLRRAGAYLAFQLPIVYVDTGLPLAAEVVRLPQAAERRFVLFADIRGDLPATRRSLSNFVRKRDEAELRLGTEASEAALWQLRGRPWLLHLDTHTKVVEHRGMHQAVLELAAGDGEDGEVRLTEWLDKLQVEPRMVSIIACRSAAAAQEAAVWDLRGVAGYLAVRGVAWVLTTFWRVADGASACFVDDYMRRLAGGERPDHALTRSQRDFPGRCGGPEAAWAAYRISILGGGGPP